MHWIIGRWCDAQTDVRMLKLLLELGGNHTRSSLRGDTPLDLAQWKHERASEAGHDAARDCLQAWLAMSEEHRGVIKDHGWDYYELPAWQPNIHSRFPA